MNLLLEIDTALFLFINVGLANPLFDIVMPFITKSSTWMPVYVTLFLWLLFFGGKEGRITFVLLILGVILTDQISANLIKELVGRLRPCKTLEDINLLVNCGAGKSFPSAHATNNFGAAFILYKFNRKWKYIVFSLAGLIAISRVFVGVHYPIDITIGALLGLTIAWSIVKFKDILLVYLNKRSTS